jgi:subtilisin family serine protease
MGYVPENTLVVVGPLDSLTQATDHPAVVWWGHHEPDYKMDPDWENLLPAIEAASTSPDELMALPIRIDVRQQSSHSNETLLVGVRVYFPVSWHAAPLPKGHEAEGAVESRAQRLRQERNRLDLATAAAADWGPLLGEHVGQGGVEIHSGGPSSVVVLSPPQALRKVLEWLSERPAVRWISPLARHARRNHQGTVITQAARAAPQNPGTSGNLDPDVHPVWNAGITGGGQIIGQGDSGIDYKHCFFVDPNVNFTSHISIVGGVPQFDSTTHRKLRMYRAYADFQDANGHGTHTAGTLAGIPYGTSVDADGAINIGNAPDAKIAFIDLSSAANGDSITTPYDLGNGYFKYTTAVGAYVHSDSWGSNSITYDSESVQVDGYVWENPTFLPVFPAGNDGTAATPGQSTGSSTVNSPATAKNCIAAGATQTAGQFISPSTLTGTTWTATVLPQGATGNSNNTLSFLILQSSFSPGFGSLTSSSSSYRIVAASPLQACSSLSNLGGLSGAVVLVERGNCTYLTKAQMAAAAGAAACLIFDDVVESYFIASSPNSQSVSIPVATIPRQNGQSIMAFLSAGHSTSISFGSSSTNAAGFDNLAVFSSKGPVGGDLRIKPDLVAPGLLTSALTGSSCGTVTYGGTSMATPTIAGSAALVRQYFQSGFYPSGTANSSAGFTPSGALIKAVLIAGATSMGGFEADTGLPVPAAPSYSQGFGRVFLGQSLFLPNNPYSPQKLAVLDAVPIAGGDVHQFCITATGGPLSIALVWTDYPGDPTAVYSLVNNLDLVVRAEGFNGQPLLGNGGDVKDASVADQSNNVEVVSLGAFPPGRVSIQVSGTAVQALAGGQHYSLVVTETSKGPWLCPHHHHHHLLLLLLLRRQRVPW